MSRNCQTLDAIFNDGERLIPGETHGRDEVVRHKSSYQLFRQVIESDILHDPSMLVSGFNILDIGCGTGHGTFMLRDILGAQIVGIDPSIESIRYANNNYSARNIQYVNSDAESYVREARTFHYVVSRHALEHVVDGLNFALKVVCRKRLMVNVPFNEGDGNVHHLVHWIKEEQFEAYPNKEFFYEGLDGVTELTRTSENPPNSILCVSSAPELKPVHELFDFPIAAWKPEFLQNLGIKALESDIEQRELHIRQRQLNAELAMQALQSDFTLLQAECVDLKQQLHACHAIWTAHESHRSQFEEQIKIRKNILDSHEAALKQTEAMLENRKNILDSHEAALKQSETMFSQRGTMP